MDKNLLDFMSYLEGKKKLSQNSLTAYRRDVEEFFTFLKEKGTGDICEVSNTDVISYLLKLKNEGKSGSTVNRKIASLRSFFRFLLEKGIIEENPTLHIRSPKIERRVVEYLTIEEVERLLKQPDTSIKGLRDQAILELLYAAGIRVSEITGTNVEDINLRIGFITCTGEHGKARIIPLGRPARQALETYIYEVRPKFLRNKSQEETALFLNYYGERMTRQGLWKLMKEYAKSADLEHKLTPQILRNSFAVHMIQNGADLKSLQDLLGHEDITATQIYLSVAKNHIKDVYDRTHPRA
ncbi:site-specific tyrosine recombinase XerD [Anaerovorax sp. IOR16]|uniref:site-specific tyrosine recombinase XerD n=1 Tax=Anaerovorax sp. IOR16 TaxID=2773458 RepID=UPI0019D04BA7|nr:site-specific tyrosine recombinase XerD [Anaerovorax sp. IOR16]